MCWPFTTTSILDEPVSEGLSPHESRQISSPIHNIGTDAAMTFDVTLTSLVSLVSSFYVAGSPLPSNSKLEKNVLECILVLGGERVTFPQMSCVFKEWGKGVCWRTFCLGLDGWHLETPRELALSTCVWHYNQSCSGHSIHDPLGGKINQKWK